MLDHSLFRNYDIRGEYGKELTEDAMYTIARAFVVFSGVKRVVIGADMRISSPALLEAAIRGLIDSGVDVESVGLTSTDALYFATWHGQYDGGLMITASHMPKQFNGVKFLRTGTSGMLEPIGRGIGMEELEDIANNIEAHPVSEQKGAVKSVDIWDDFVTFVKGFVDFEAIRDLNVVMDAGNAMGGFVAPKIFDAMNIDVTTLFFELDGAFPNHDPNPFLPENRKDIEAKVVDVGADLGVAWDADCDRCYFIDEKGNFVHSDFIIVLLAKHFLEKNPGAHIVYDLRGSWAIPHWIKKLGGVPHMSRVGHTYIKPSMREVGAVFGGENSGHYYFADNAFMDNGFIPALIVMEAIVKSGKTLSELVAELGDYHVSGEVNFEVHSIEMSLAKLKERYADATLDELDGLSVEYADWHFNARPSANDPVLRLNLEATSETLLKEKFEEVKGVIVG